MAPPTYKIIGNRCVILFDESNEVFCRALYATKLFGGVTITKSFTNISFYAKKVCSLREHLTQRREKLQYVESVKMAQYLGQQLFYLEKYAHTFAWFNLDNVLVIDDESSFLCVGTEQLVPIDTIGRIWFTTPFSVKQQHIAPEIKRLITLPSSVTHKAVYYSLGSLITFCLVDTDGAEPCEDALKFIAHTKLYWFLLRCIDDDPSARLLLFI